MLERLEVLTPDGLPKTSHELVDDLIGRVVDLELQVQRHQKELEEQAGEHNRELTTVVERVIDILANKFEITPKEG